MLILLRIRNVRNLSEVAKEHRHDDSTERDEFRGAPCKEELMSSASGKRDAETKQSVMCSIRERENSSEMALRKQQWTMNLSFPSIHLPWKQCHIVRLGTGDELILGWGLCDQRFNHSRPFWAVCVPCCYLGSDCVPRDKNEQKCVLWWLFTSKDDLSTSVLCCYHG